MANIKIDKEKITKAASKAGAGIAKQSTKAGTVLVEKSIVAKDKAMEVKSDIDEKRTELDRMLEAAINEYNEAYTLMNDKGTRLFIERTRAVDTIKFVEELVNSIANKPKTFESEFETIEVERKEFTDICVFAERELTAAREAAGGAGAGLAAGASIASMAPTAAMWVATTFGKASTGIAISQLSGAAATNAALAWLGGGAAAAGGGGMASGTALLAMAGPVGWSIAGATLLTSIALFAKKRNQNNKQKNDEISAVKENILAIQKVDEQLSSIIETTQNLREKLTEAFFNSYSLYQKDYSEFTDEQKAILAALVNSTKALSAMFGKTIQ